MVAKVGITHVIDMQVEFDDTPLAEPHGIEVLWNAIDDPIRLDGHQASGDRLVNTVRRECAQRRSRAATAPVAARAQGPAAR